MAALNGADRSHGIANARSKSSLILDGGLATQLETYGFDTSGPLWSARALVDAPELVARAQIEYADAGAECVSTATYQATLSGLAARGLRSDEAERRIAESVKLARQALADRQPRIAVAASVGPYGAALADGSEYRGDYDVGAKELRQFHRRRLELLLEHDPDYVALETIPSAIEVQVLVELLGDLRVGERGIGVWLALSVRDARHLADGSELVGEWLREALGSGELAAFGVNCLAPQLVAPVLGELREVSPLPLVAYPNSGEVWRERAWHARPDVTADDPVSWAGQARAWWDAGARLLGGCCRTGPAHIAELAQQVNQWRKSN